MRVRVWTGKGTGPKNLPEGYPGYSLGKIPSIMGMGMAMGTGKSTLTHTHLIPSMQTHGSAIPIVQVGPTLAIK